MPDKKRPLKVFLSYASQDKLLVRELSRRLAREGWIDTWQDEKSLLPGQDWREKIEEAVEEADVVIICLSRQSVSKEGYVQKELRYAREIALEKPEDSIFLIPLRLDECEVPRGLRFYQWVDYFSDNKESSYAALVASLKLRYKQKLKTEEIEYLPGEEAEREAAEKEAVEKAGLQAKKKEKRESEKKEEKRVAKPKAGVQIIYWFGGFIVLALGIILLSLLTNPSSIPQPTPEKAQTEPTATFPQKSVEPSATASPKSTSTPASTFTSTPLPTEIMDVKETTMVLVPEGGFAMGNNDYFTDETPVHFVLLNSYYIDKYEVTNINYSQCVNDGVCLPPTKRSSYSYSDYFGNPTFSRYPVIYITWQMANEYCEWRGSRLPTEAEWEKAARGNSGRNYPWGDSVEGTFANYNGIEGDVKPIGSFLSGISPYGVMDLSGNVQEWVNDWYQADYYSSLPSNIRDPMGPSSGNEKVLRGGSWDAGKNFIRTTYRSKDNPSTSFYNIGFRCARATDSTPKEVTPTSTPSGFELISISEIAYRGGKAGAEIKTQPGTACELGYILPSGALSGAAGTGPDTADENGVCSWEWVIAHGTIPGWGNIYIKAGGMDESYPIEIK